MPREVHMDGERRELHFSPFPVLEAHLHNRGGMQYAGMFREWQGYLGLSFWGFRGHMVEDGPRDKVGGQTNTSQDSSPLIWDTFLVSWDFFFLSLYNSDSAFPG